MPTTTIVNDPRDIQTFHFTHLEMAILSVGLSTFQSELADSHINGHVMAGQCNKGEATIIAMASNIQSVLSDRMIPERMAVLMEEILAGKYS